MSWEWAEPNTCNVMCVTSEEPWCSFPSRMSRVRQLGYNVPDGLTYVGILDPFRRIACIVLAFFSLLLMRRLIKRHCMYSFGARVIAFPVVVCSALLSSSPSLLTSLLSSSQLLSYSTKVQLQVYELHRIYSRADMDKLRCLLIKTRCIYHELPPK